MKKIKDLKLSKQKIAHFKIQEIKGGESDTVSVNKLCEEKDTSIPSIGATACRVTIDFC